MLAETFEDSEGAMATSVDRVHHPLEREERECLHVVYVWEWPVRFAHWMIVGCIVLLTLTGYYLYDPLVVSRGSGAFFMAKVRFTHEVTGFIFIAVCVLRGYWFFKGNKWARWKQFVLVGKERRKDLKQWLKYYLFLRRKTIPQVGHNPLAGLTYAVVYFLILVEILTGLTLYNHLIGSRLLGFFTGWLPMLISIRYLREIHFLIMFALWAFFLHHYYSVVLVSIEEKTGGIAGSIFSGYKYVTEQVLQDDALRNPDDHKPRTEQKPQPAASGKTGV
jgi:Ni/Fe-hydrogenase 1 B-type cytochrome subunit